MTEFPPTANKEARRMLDEWPTGRLVSAVARRIEHEWNAHLAQWDLNHASLPVLFLLLGGPRSQRELARASGVTEQTMSRIVARLERSGYVERHAPATDARRHDVVLTDPGRAALMAAGDPRIAEEMGVRGLTAAQVDQLRALLSIMLAAHPGGAPADPPGDPPAGPPDASDQPAPR